MLSTIELAPYWTYCLYFSSSLKLFAWIAAWRFFLFFSYSLVSSSTNFSSSSLCFYHCSSFYSFWIFLNLLPERSLQESKLSTTFFFGFIDLRREPNPPLPPFRGDLIETWRVYSGFNSSTDCIGLFS